MPKPKVSSFADDLSAVLTEQPSLRSSRSFADDLASIETEMPAIAPMASHRSLAEIGLQDTLDTIHPPTSPRDAEVTQLSPDEERVFRRWATQNRITDVDSPDSRYDYRGFWKSTNGAPHVPGNEEHFPDTYKQHGHPSFSAESTYSRGRQDGGEWVGDSLMPPPVASHAADQPLPDLQPAWRPGAPIQRSRTGTLYQTPPMGTNPLLDAHRIGGQQIAQGARELRDVVADLSLAPVSAEPPQRRLQRTVERGSQHIIDPRVYGGAADIVEGGMTATTPLLVGAGLGAPLKTAAALTKAVIAAKATEKTVAAVGAPPEAARLAGDVAGALAAGIPIAEHVVSGVARAGEAARSAGDAAVARRQAAGRIEPLPTDIEATAVRANEPPFEPIPRERALVRRAPDVPVSPIVEPSAAPPAPVEPIVEPGRPGGSFAEDLAAVKQEGTGQTLPVEILPTGRNSQVGKNPSADVREGSFAADLASVEEPAEQQKSGSFAEDLKKVTVPPADDIGGKPGQLNVPAKKVPYETITDDQRHELRRVLTEMEQFPFVKKTFNEVPAKHGNSYDIVAGAAGAPVYNHIVTTDRSGRPMGDRGQVVTAIRSFLNDGKRSALSDRALEVVDRRLAGDRTLSQPSLPSSAGDLPYGMALRRRLELSAEERRIEDVFARQIERRPFEAIRQYRDKFGNVANSDLAKELAGPNVYGTPAQRTNTSRALHGPSHELARAVFREALTDNVPEGKSNLAVFTAGGTGSGKSSSLNQIFPELKEAAHVVYDSTFANTPDAIEDVQAALDTDHEVGIVFTKRDIREAFTNGVLTRAMTEGRPVSIASHVRTHIGALDTIRAVAEHFKDDPRVAFMVIDNPASGPREIVGMGHDLRALEGVRYDAASVRDQLAADLDAEVKAGRVSESVAVATRDARRALPAEPGQAGPRPPQRGARAKKAGEVGSPQPSGARVSIKPTKYRGEDGFSISGRDTHGRKVKIFATTSGAAEHIVEKIKRGEFTEPGDFAPRPSRGRGTQSAAPAAGHSFRQLPTRPQNATRTPPEARLKPSAIIERLRKVIGDIPNRTGRFRQRALGIYKPDAQTIRLKLANDLQTFFHESGHHVDLGVLQLQNKDPRWKRELEGLGQPTSRASYTKQQVQQEGAAEFLRLWMTEPSVVKRQAPNYFAAFEDALKNHPELATGLRDVQKDVQQLLAVDPADRAKLHVDFSGKEPGVAELVAEDPRRAIRAVATETVDDLWALRHAVAEMRDGRPMQFRHNAYVLARIARGAAGKAEAFLEHGVRMRNGQFSGPSLADAIQPVKERIEDFGMYLVALRSEEMARRGMESGLTREEAQAVIEKTEADPAFKDFERARDNIYAFQDAVLEYARQFGALSKDQIRQIKRVNEFYIPMQRVFDATDAAFTGAAKRIADRTLPVKRIKGSGRDIVNPFESIVKNTFAMVDMVEKNRAMIALVNQAQQSVGSGRWIERIPDPQVATHFNLQKLTGQVRAALEDAGIDLPDNLDDALDDLVTVFTPASFGKQSEQIVTVLRKGEREFWQVNDQQLYDAIAVIGPQVSTRLLQWASLPTRVLRAGATLTPGFIIRNPARDTLVAYLQSRYGFIPVYDTLRGFVGQVLGDADAKQFFASGVVQATLAGSSRVARREVVKQISQHKGEFLRYIVWHPIDLMRAISEQMEVATRLGEFKLALDAGGVERGLLSRLFNAGKGRPEITEETLTRGTLAARDVTTDFSRGGRITREANSYYAFFNARVQGWVRMAETVGRDPSGVSLKLASLALFSAALWWLNHDDDDYRKKEPWEKRTYWHLRLSPSLPFIKIPKPFEWGYAPDLVEATLSYLHETDPDSLKTIIPQGQAMGQIAVALAPTVIAPLLEAGMNYDAFRDTKIVRPWDLNLDPELQYNQWSSETAKKLGKVMGIAPLKIDHIIYGYTAGSGRSVVSAVDDQLRRVGLAPPDAAPANHLAQKPVIGTFLDDGAKGFSSQHIQDLYDAAEEIERLEGSVKQYVKKGDRARAIERVQDDRDQPWFDRRSQVKAAAAAFRELAPAIKAIYALPPDKMSPEEKRRRLDAIADRMDAIALQALGKPQHHEDVQSDVLHQLGIAR